MSLFAYMNLNNTLNLETPVAYFNGVNYPTRKLIDFSLLNNQNDDTSVSKVINHTFIISMHAVNFFLIIKLSHQQN